MWHAVAPVTREYDTILYESDQPSAISVLNAGPGGVLIRAWIESFNSDGDPSISINLVAGNIRFVCARLIRARLAAGSEFSAIAWAYLGHGTR